MNSPLLALFCSRSCPAALIPPLYDTVRGLRDADVHVVSGFQSSLERDCLDILLRGASPVTLCPARPLKRVPGPWKQAIAEGRMRLVPANATGAGRITSAIAHQRNQFVAALADALFIAHASPGGKTESLARQAIADGKPVFTLPGPHNAHLAALGARTVTAADLVDCLSPRPHRIRAGQTQGEP